MIYSTCNWDFSHMDIFFAEHGLTIKVLSKKPTFYLSDGGEATPSEPTYGFLIKENVMGVWISKNDVTASFLHRLLGCMGRRG